MRFKTLIRNINLLNILLISVIIISISYSLLPLLDIKVKYTLPAAKKIGEQKEEKAIQTQSPSTVEYTIIAEENLFHPERKIPVEKKEEKPLPKPEIVLYGTLITDDMSLAFIENLKAPYSTPGRGKRQTALRKGDSISGFTLKEIEAEKIVMVRGEEKMEVYLTEPSHPKVREVLAPSSGVAPQPASTPSRPPSASTQQQPSAATQQPVPPSQGLKTAPLPAQEPKSGGQRGVRQPGGFLGLGR